MGIRHLYTSLLFLIACNEQQEGFKSPAGYDLGKPEKFVMIEALNEISGISFYGDSLYAIQDEDGKLFYLQPGNKETGSSKFGKKGDYEDLSIVRGQVIVLRSDGTLFSFGLSGAEEIADTKEWKDLVQKGEYEGLYADEVEGLIYVLCKQCKRDKKSGEISIAVLQLQTDDSILPVATISMDVKTRNFHPSAIARDPRTLDWYILSSASKMLVIADSDWKVKEQYPLDPALFRQPEGIAFDRNNNLYISNEGDAISNGNVLKFVYNQNN